MIERQRKRNRFTALGLIAVVILWLPQAAYSAARLDASTLQAWDFYVGQTEERISRELENPATFLRLDAGGAAIRNEVRNGKVHIEKLRNPPSPYGPELRNGMIHHWYGSIFLPGMTLQRVLAWVQDYDRHSRYFKEVEESRLLSHRDGTFQIFLRLTKKSVVTAHYNTTHTVAYRNHGPTRTSSRSIATRIAELDNPGTARETERPAGDDNGFLWRLNSYWRFSEEANGVFVECESISLSRSIPTGLGWLIGRYVESIPRESLEDTLTAIRTGAAD